jgi:HEAT repeats
MPSPQRIPSFRAYRRLLVNVLTGTLTLLAAVLLWNWSRSATPDHGLGGLMTEEPTRPGAAGGLYRAGQAAVDGNPYLPTPAPGQTPQPPLDGGELAAAVRRGMADWSSAIRERNAERVEALDRAFAEHPRDFMPALMASAESDSDERVRAFSTRVLGKLRSVETQALMRRLLNDASEYVRFNAVWSLGELQDHEAVAELRRLGKRDRSPMVRQAANESLRRIVGG